jgi:hypothetical protein
MSVFATPRDVSFDECLFYHTMDVPDIGLVHGQWDLRNTLKEYIGGADLTNKRVLEIGTTDGYICFSLEKEGADVIAFDLSIEQEWDIVPFSNLDISEIIEERKDHINRLNNAFWFCHRKFNSHAKMVYGSVYTIPKEIGDVDVTIFGSVLLHVRDPFLALQKALTMTREMVIISEPLPSWQSRFVNRLNVPLMVFLPETRKRMYLDTWWALNSRILSNMISVLGFTDITVTYHSQTSEKDGLTKKVPYFTVIGRRKR